MSRAPQVNATRRERIRATQCKWCEQSIPTGKRKDAETCSKRCRQAFNRFKVNPSRAAQNDTSPKSFAYADPPYPKLAKRYYKLPEVDHRKLIAHLVASYPDGWALSTSSKSLRDVLQLCPPGVRVLAWVKMPRGRSEWEPVILYGGRRTSTGPRDVLTCKGRQRSHPGALVGMKPAAFCEWVFRWLGARQGDTLADLYPGSGAVRRAWRLFQGVALRDRSCSGDASPEHVSSLPAAATRPRDRHATLSAEGDTSRRAGQTRRKPSTVATPDASTSLERRRVRKKKFTAGTMPAPGTVQD